MKTILLFFFIGINFCFAGSSHSQVLLSLNATNKTMKDVFTEIEKKSDYVFFYSDQVKKSLGKKVSVSSSSERIEEILNQLFEGSGMTYRLSGRQIIVSASSEEAMKKEAQKKEIPIAGNVMDNKGQPLIGVNVLVKGTTTGVMTDMNGSFSIPVSDNQSILVFSYIGYYPKEVTVGTHRIIDVVLEENVGQLDEVVVTAYGSQKKASIVGAIETIKPENLQVGSTRSLSNNLAGQIAGIIAVQRSGEPGSDNSSFWIRGISTFSGTTTPLVLVDGIERDLNNIDPAEIESFSVLKDASASAMYGVRGANGVIVINTKRGKIGKPTVNFRLEHAISAPTKLPDYIGAADYMALRNKLAEDQSDLPFSTDRIEKTRSNYDPDLYPDVDWIDAVTKDYSYNTRANLTVNGGSAFLRYALITSYYNEKGIIETDPSLAYDTGINLDRYNMRANVDADITKTTTLRLNVGGYLQSQRGPYYSSDDILTKAYTRAPYVFPIHYSNGVIPYENISGNAVNNPWAMATQYGYSANTYSQFQSLFSLEQDLKMIIQGLKAKFIFSFDTYKASYLSRAANPSRYSVATGRDDEGDLITTLLSYGDESLGLSSSGGYGNTRTYMEGNITYNRTFGKHDFDALFLYNQQSYDTGTIQPYRKQGIAGRLSYIFDSRYVGEFNFGHNGSENFAKGKRFGFFPSVAIGWLASEESFMEPIKSTVDKLKLRLSYGKVGNDNIGGRRFAYITTVGTTSGYQWGENHSYEYTGYTDGEIGVANLTWETSWKTDFGIELGLLNALQLQVDFFKEKRSNIFMQRETIPAQAGFASTPWANYGKVNNKGVDISLNYNKKINNDWNIGIRSSFTYAKNTVIEKDEPAGRLGTYRSITGQSLNTLWGLVADRLFTKDDFNEDGSLKEGIPNQYVGSTTLLPGDIKYVDRNGDGQITSDDEGYIGGTTDPRIIYGFGATVNYKKWDLSFFFQGMGDTYRLIAPPIPGNSWGDNVYSNYLDSWSEENPSQNVFYPRLSSSNSENDQNYKASTWWKKDMSLLRCKTIELGYSLPQRMMNKIGAKSFRFYISGNNLFYFSKFNLWDPEISTTSGAKYPQMRSVMFGLDVNF